MPTPMPIMAASWVANSGTEVAWESSSTTAKPTPMPNRAVRMGRPMASTEPKAISRMTMAAMRPIASVLPGGRRVVKMSPPPSTWRPGPLASLMSDLSWSLVGLVDVGCAGRRT